MPNAWIEHIKKFSKENNTTFACALSNPKTKETYKKPSQTQTKQPTFKEIAENRKKANKYAKTLSSEVRKEARSLLNSPTKSDKNYSPIDLNKDKVDFNIRTGLKKKKSGVIFD